MSIEIYYFTGTGNSLALAGNIAGKINGKLISIPSVMDRQIIHADADAVGIVFPCYLSQLYGIPLIVERFVKKIENIGSIKYLFAVCSFGGYPIVNGLPVLKNLSRLIKSCGGRLSGEFPVRMPMNNLDYDHIPIPISKDHDKMYKNSRIKLEDICRHIIKRKKTKYRILISFFNMLLTPMYRSLKKYVVADLKKRAKEPEDSGLDFHELIQLTDKSITADEKCNGCGICAKVCPVHNIQINDNKPIWLHHCEICFACDEWCPRQAIRHWSRAAGVKYRHPDIKISDMIKQNLTV